MHIIMTHEQADFDAMASLLAAALIQDGAYALYPKKMNRNVLSFIDLYGGELPFYDIKQIPQQKIEKVTLVDTQSLVTIKGMSKDLQVHIVDHHTKRDDLPPSWTSVFEKTGACATILIEDLQRNHFVFNMIQSTLLLLGIYEDTGSLSYAGTTPRDLRAAAFLIENSASLAIANQYLDPPLSDDQQLIYNSLLRNAEHLEILGNRIVTAMASAEDLNEEISSIAHKIRDLLDPDALFLLVKTSEGIRMVARSTSDQIHVGKIAQAFGGGGHPRAAAALIHTEDNSPPLDFVYASLVQKLPAFVEPTIKVGQIMSKNPLLITPQTSANDAAQLMQRYGYEGYPVVENSEIVGLLNRRSVDRALRHKIDLSAASLMEAGKVFVDETSSLEDVQKLMTASGWGQIPVLSKETKQIIGIVTRTDLIKALGKTRSTNTSLPNLTTLLNKTLTTAQISFLQLIAGHAHHQKLPVFIVGGFVRDLILERPGLDFDIVVEGDAIALAKSLQNRFNGKISTHKRFGTAKWFIKSGQTLLIDLSHENISLDAAELPESLDFISARTEFYDYPTALPQVERSSIKLDLHRRDFSINTMALRLDGRHFGELYDHWGGLSDLNDGLIRVLHSLSFVDDPTRLIRAVRFEQRFGFRIEPRTRQLLQEAIDLLKQVSGDRIRHELNLILQEADPVPALLRLEELGLTHCIHPQLTINAEIAAQIKKLLQTPIPQEWKLPPPFGINADSLEMAYIAWLINLKQGFKSICKRLRMPAKVTAGIEKALGVKGNLSNLKDMRPSEVTEILGNIPNEVIYIFYCIHGDAQLRDILFKYITHWQMVKPFTSGNELQASGIKPGPVYRELLKQLRDAWLDGSIKNVDQELALLGHLIHQANQHE